MKENCESERDLLTLISFVNTSGWCDLQKRGLMGGLAATSFLPSALLAVFNLIMFPLLCFPPLLLIHLPASNPK